MKKIQIVLFVLSVVAAGSGCAQTQPAHEVVGASALPQALGDPAPGTIPEDGEVVYSAAELDQMLAPIALYPDSVLTHILIASTYPLEVVEAERWRAENPELDPEEALNAVEDQSWDASVKALVAFPRLLTQMSQDLRWTQSLGDAFLLSEAAVMDRVQVLRNDAYSAGELQSSPEVQVVVEKQIIEKVERRTIIIEPVVERVVYLPHYDTRRVYGSWRWASYPPVYWDPFHTPLRRSYSVYWGPAFRVAPAFYIGAFHWPNRQVVVINHVNYRPAPVFYRSRSLARHHSATHWHHKPQHRRGVAYHPVFHARYGHRPEYRKEYRNEYRREYQRELQRERSREFRREHREADRFAERQQDRNRSRANDTVFSAPQRRDHDTRREPGPRPEGRTLFDATGPQNYGRNADAERRAGLQSFADQRAERQRSRVEAPRQRQQDRPRQAERSQEARQSGQQIARRAEQRAPRERSERAQEPREQRQEQSARESRAAPALRESRDPGGNRQSWRGDNRRDR